jgi:hypothetical protein
LGHEHPEHRAAVNASARIAAFPTEARFSCLDGIVRIQEKVDRASRHVVNVFRHSSAVPFTSRLKSLMITASDDPHRSMSNARNRS